MKKKIAEKLNGINFPCEIPLDIIGDLAIHNLVAIYHLDDDEVYLKGAISEKLNILDGESVYFDSNGFFLNKCEEDDDCPYFKEKKETAIASIKSSDYEFETDIPHEEFKVYEAGEVHCVGIVFDMKDISTTDNNLLIREILRELNRGRICVSDAHRQLREKGLINDFVETTMRGN